MGFWNTLVEGAKEAGGWVLDHAGDVAQVVGTVAKVAGLLIFSEENGDAGHQNHLEDFYRNFKTASEKLEEEAKTAALSAHSRSANVTDTSDFSDTTPVLDSVTGVWKAPAPLQEKGQPSVPMYQDLAKWFATLGVPAGAIDEAATAIARGIFAVNMDPLVNGQVHSASCHYTPPDGSFTLDCGHAFYHLPLGATSQDKYWHSSIYAIFRPSNTHLEAKRMKGAVPTTVLNKLKPGSPVWIVNAIINWGNASVATALHDKLIQALIGADAGGDGLNVFSSNLLGASQSIQIQGSLKDNPSTLHQSLISSAAKVLSAMLVPPGVDHTGGVLDTPIPCHGIPLMVPEVNVTESQLVCMPDLAKRM
ncbi:hypothetical protein PG997_012209 [Apiospora hydei]|uniref:Uncharacterized protein n=1 Tax=Apiospora hydei TaxID=1337664 RepID=A0ABR1V2Q0_9PEZI